MPFKRQSMRYAHAEGHTHVCYTTDSENIITCGNDGDYRTWVGLDDDDPSSTCIGEWALCVAHREGRLFVSSDNNSVQAYTYPDGDKDGVIVRFSGPVSHFEISEDKLVAGGQDNDVQVVSLEGNASVKLSGHTGPILGVALNKAGTLAASSSGDGTIKVWSVDDQNVVKQFDCIPKVNNFLSAKVLGRVSFEPVDGKYLAYPHDKEVIIVDINNWQQKKAFTHNRVKCSFSICSFSPCGLYLAASSIAGEICVWNVDSQKCTVFSEHPTSHNVCSLAWNPSGNKELAFCDVNGQLGTIEQCYNINEKPTETINENDVVEHSNENFNNTFFMPDDLDDPDEDGSDDEINKLDSKKVSAATSLADIRDLASPSHASGKEYVEAVPLHVPFQPGSTPFHLENRFMTWNHVGVVRSHIADTESSIEVEFHDSSTHHSIHMNNYMNHTMASLSTSVLALSCETPSKLVCIALGSSGSKEWSIELPQGEESLAVAAADKLVAVATDARMLRLFSILGMQREVISIPGPVIALAGYADKILVAYHSAPATISDPNISLMFIQAVGLRVRCTDIRAPLTPSSKLTWLGFTDRGSPVTFDSDGMLRVYMTRAGVWLPLCDTTKHVKGISDNFFIVEVSEVSQVLRAVLCRGTRYPVTNPKPHVSELEFQFPMCEIDTEKTILEEKLCRWSHSEVDQNEKLFKETALKLFALACRSEYEQRAQELIEIIESPQLLSLAIKYASKLGRMHLADKLSDLAGKFDERAPSPVPSAEERNNVSVATTPLSQNNSLLLLNKPESSTPVIAPLAMKALSQKRNPFKKSFKPGVRTPNPLSHLTDKAVGFSSPETQGSFSLDSQSSEPNTPKASHESSETFMNWFSREKPNLEEEFPDLSPTELTKQAMKRFKTKSSHKRKLSDDAENNVPVAKQSKLSAFAFKK